MQVFWTDDWREDVMNSFPSRRGLACWSAACFVLLLGATPAVRAADEPAPDAAPQIQTVQPAQGAPGAEVNLTIEGANFSRGVYVSFSNPALRPVSTRRASADQLEVRVQIGAKALPGPVTLYVSNPASAAAQTTFMVMGDGGTAGATRSAGTSVQAYAASATAPVAAEPAPADTPEVSSVEPSSVGRGSTIALKVKGKHFVEGVKVAFSNPAILVTRTDFKKATELTAYLQVAPDAEAGKTSLFVVNPDDSEVETQFEITTAPPTVSADAQPPASSPATTQTSTTTRDKSAAGANGSAKQSFDVYNLGEAVSIFQSRGKAKGTLSVSGRSLQYEENGQAVFSAAAKEVKEIALTNIAGFSFGAFHVILNSGKMYNFMPASMRANDSQSIVDSLLKGLR